MGRMTLTKAQREALSTLARYKSPLNWTGPCKAMGNKLVKLGLATYRGHGYPVGFTITEAGRRALSEASHDR